MWRSGRRPDMARSWQLGKAYLGVGVDEGLLVDASNTLQVADIERILGAAVTRMLALELAVRLLLGAAPASVRPSINGWEARTWPIMTSAGKT